MGLKTTIGHRNPATYSPKTKLLKIFYLARRGGIKIVRCLIPIHEIKKKKLNGLKETNYIK